MSPVRRQEKGCQRVSSAFSFWGIVWPKKWTFKVSQRSIWCGWVFHGKPGLVYICLFFSVRGEKLGGTLSLHPSGNFKIILALKEVFPSRVPKQNHTDNALQMSVLTRPWHIWSVDCQPLTLPTLMARLYPGSFVSTSNNFCVPRWLCWAACSQGSACASSLCNLFPLSCRSGCPCWRSALMRWAVACDPSAVRSLLGPPRFPWELQHRAVLVWGRL